MRIWIDLANSPHVALFEPLVAHLEARGDEVVLTARDHAQTVPLARRVWGDVRIVGGESPRGWFAKGTTLVRRSDALRRLVRDMRPDIALSHGSYAQVVAARAARVPAVTMMDYEYQPANHVSFRLAQCVIVPTVFPEAALRRFGVPGRKVVRYEGFKEELYLAGFEPDPSVLVEVGVDADAILVVMRPPPEGALYHQHANPRFDQLLEDARVRAGVRVVVLPRSGPQSKRYRVRNDVVVPGRPVEGRSLVACADIVIGAGGTMNREAALLGTPTYTVFGGRFAAVDAELLRLGYLRDLRDPASAPVFEKKKASRVDVLLERRAATLAVVERALDAAA